MTDDKKPEISRGGSQIQRHPPRERKRTEPPAHRAAAEIEKHMARLYGEPSMMFEDKNSDLVRLDVKVIPPATGHDCYTLYTTGMSDLPMAAPEGEELFAELMIMLPREWDMDAVGKTPRTGDAERWLWPVQWLRQLARFPHEYKTWLGYGHSIPNGEPPEPFHPSTKLCGWLILSPLSVPYEETFIPLSDGRTVKLFGMHGLHAEEMRFKLDKGTEALLDAFERAVLSEVLDPGRPSVRRQFLGLVT